MTRAKSQRILLSLTAPPPSGSNREQLLVVKDPLESRLGRTRTFEFLGEVSATFTADKICFDSYSSNLALEC